MFRSIKRLFSNDVQSELEELEEVQPISEAAASTAMAYPDLLDAITALLNNDLPPVVQGSLDLEKERQLLAQRIGTPLQQLENALQTQVARKLQGGNQKLEAEMKELKERSRLAESKQQEQKDTLMSEQRQRRALQERNRDLEAQIAQLNSEIDQLHITVSALTNKLRVAEINEADAKARQEVQPLQEQPADNALQQQLEQAYAEIEALKKQIESAAQAKPEAEPRKRRGRPRKPQGAVVGPSEVDNLDSVDWLLPDGEKSGKSPVAHDPNFGYQPPKTLPEPDPDMQLTLF